MNEEKIIELKSIIEKSKRIVFFGGAGVSVPSGIPDFRSAGGIYSKKTNQKYSPEEMVSHHFFLEHTNLFYEFYFKHMIYKDAKPNIVHYKLAEWEKEGKLFSVVTQNIDGLHEQAGSKKVIELHGNVNRNYCMVCHKFYSLDELNTMSIPKCQCGGVIKPDVVLFEEQLDDDAIEEAVRVISKADTLIVGGTSLYVYPAANLLQYFRGRNIVVINLEERFLGVPEFYHYLSIQGDIAEVFKKL